MTREADLQEALEKAKARGPMTPWEREEQARNFAVGNVGMEDPRITRELMDRALGPNPHPKKGV